MFLYYLFAFHCCVFVLYSVNLVVLGILIIDICMDVDLSFNFLKYLFWAQTNTVQYVSNLEVARFCFYLLFF